MSNYSLRIDFLLYQCGYSKNKDKTKKLNIDLITFTGGGKIKKRTFMHFHIAIKDLNLV